MFSEHVQKKTRLVSYKTKEHTVKKISEAVIKSTKNVKLNLSTGSFLIVSLATSFFSFFNSFSIFCLFIYLLIRQTKRQ